MIKTFVISEGAFSENKGVGNKKIKKSKGGFIVNPVSNPVSNLVSNPVSNLVSNLVSNPVSNLVSNTKISPNVTGSYIGGKQNENEKHIKVELKKKISVKKVHLNPKMKTTQKTHPKKIKKSRKFVLGI